MKLRDSIVTSLLNNISKKHVIHVDFLDIVCCSTLSRKLVLKIHEA